MRASDDYTVIIPTRNRPQLLERAVRSALSQALPPSEVIVVDDGSEPPVSMTDYDRVRVIRHFPSRGVSAARNTGLHAAKAHWVTFLDDDDELLPHMAATSLQLAHTSDLPAPVAALTAMEVVDPTGRRVHLRQPPTLARGHYFSLENPPRGKSFLSKQTLFIEREVLQSIGGWDESFRSRETTEMFLRLNPICSLAGSTDVTYRQHRHAGPRLSTDQGIRNESFDKLVEKHKAALELRPRGYVRMLRQEAGVLRRNGDRLGQAMKLLRALQVRLGMIFGGARAR